MGMRSKDSKKKKRSAGRDARSRTTPESRVVKNRGAAEEAENAGDISKDTENQEKTGIYGTAEALGEAADNQENPETSEKLDSLGNQQAEKEGNSGRQEMEAERDGNGIQEPDRAEPDQTELTESARLQKENGSEADTKASSDGKPGAEKESRAEKKNGAKKTVRRERKAEVSEDFVSGIERKTKARSRRKMKEEEEQRYRQRRINRRALQRERRAQEVRRQKIFLIMAGILLLLILAVGSQVVRKGWASSTISEEVLAYRETVEKYAKESEIEDYVDVLLAIMMVESEGVGEDVMQSSESKGLERNSLKPEESIEQACIYFDALVDIAKDLGIKDEKALIQAYNFGPGYLEYLAEHGKKHSQKLAIEYAKEQSKGKKVRYMHLYAIQKNGGWIYKFGNMFYDALVQQYL